MGAVLSHLPNNLSYETVSTCFKILKAKKGNVLRLIIEALASIFYSILTRKLYFPPSEMVTLFNEIAENPDCRVVVVSGAGKMFTAGWYQAIKIT